VEKEIKKLEIWSCSPVGQAGGMITWSLQFATRWSGTEKCPKQSWLFC